MIKRIFCRNILLFSATILLLCFSVQWQECFMKRGKYLLGIVYNGNFLNLNDKIVYEDYLRRQGSTAESFQKNL